MKKQTIFALIIGAITTISLNAQKVALHTSTGVQHFNGINGFIDAYNAASSRDTIYLPGGGFTAPSKIEKQLYVYGAGHYPDSTTTTSKTFINGNITLDDLADEFYLEGVEINGQFLTDYNESVDNVIVKYCKMNSINIQGNQTFANASDNVVFINSVISGGVNLSNAQNCGVFNSIIQDKIVYSQGNSFENNIFMFSHSGTTTYYTFTGDNNIVNNTIFLNASSRYFNGTSNQINNNIFIVNPILGNMPIDSGNYSPVAQNEIFVNQTENAFDYEHDYHLQNPATFLGTDGSQVGIYGGTFGYKEGAVPSNPHIQIKNIEPTTTSGGMLNIQINAAAQDN